MKNVDTSCLPREVCIKLLEAVCIQSYNHESTETLREAVEVNVMDGTISNDLYNTYASEG